MAASPDEIDSLSGAHSESSVKVRRCWLVFYTWGKQNGTVLLCLLPLFGQPRVFCGLVFICWVALLIFVTDASEKGCATYTHVVQVEKHFRITHVSRATPKSTSLSLESWETHQLAWNWAPGLLTTDSALMLPVLWTRELFQRKRQTSSGF